MKLNWINVILGALVIIIEALGLSSETTGWMIGILGILIVITSLAEIFSAQTTEKKTF